ncbi:hypothetical protein PRZ48_010319 [Zasmidium cellare]|uniref:Thioester reductase (TE) domain-containing protein n=1 Tax=Zasmidium cellare TaxID=395010 RepID=A0ABR0E8X4_ZASCE|nr:hypothetical protein PRZ48_010319 [Zasmidium cellare]
MRVWIPRAKKDNEFLSSDGSSVEQKASTVLLTGSTGNFGSYLLDHLLSQPWVDKVVCLNRSTNAQGRQLEAHKERGLEMVFDRVSFYQADFSDQRLGLSDTDYNRLASTVDLVIHNAWPVDFNRNFRSFKSSVDGVQHFIDFCISNKDRSTKLLFISSIGATSNWGSAAPTSRSKIPEVELTDWKVARTGYGQSKLVAERLLSHAAREVDLPASVVRVGQLGGPVLHGDARGKWTEKEWLPSLIRSSITLRALPENLGPVEDIDWVPVDIAAVALAELAFNLVQTAQNPKTGANFFHLVNPSCTQWTKLVPSMTSMIPTDVRLVGFVEWVTILKESVNTAGGFQGVDEGVNPAAKLIDFFDNLQDRAIRFPKAKSTLLETRETMKVSKTLAELDAVGPEWMALWMRQWRWSVDVDAAR